MYGTVARLQVKPGNEAALLEVLGTFDRQHVPGAVSVRCYRMDTNPSEIYMVVEFESATAYKANANSTEQDARYREMRALLSADPEWHDGEIVYQSK